jgi:hypothetical protein
MLAESECSPIPAKFQYIISPKRHVYPGWIGAPTAYQPDMIDDWLKSVSERPEMHTSLVRSQLAYYMNNLLNSTNLFLYLL